MSQKKKQKTFNVLNFEVNLTLKYIDRFVRFAQRLNWYIFFVQLFIFNVQLI